MSAEVIPHGPARFGVCSTCRKDDDTRTGGKSVHRLCGTCGGGIRVIIPEGRDPKHPRFEPCPVCERPHILDGAIAHCDGTTDHVPALYGSGEAQGALI